MKVNTRTIGVFLLVLSLLFMGAEPTKARAQSPSQNYGAVKGTIGATAAMYGAAAAAGVCTIMTAGMCGAVVGGVVLGGVSATMGMFPTPPTDVHGPKVGQMPDGGDDEEAGGTDECASGGDGHIDPFGFPCD